MARKASEKFLNSIMYGPQIFIATIVIPIITTPMKNTKASTNVIA